MHSLSDSTQGYTYTIKWMFGLPEVMKSMHDMNIHEGSTIRVLRKFHDSLIISSANRKIVLEMKLQTEYRYSALYLNVAKFTRQRPDKCCNIQHLSGLFLSLFYQSSVFRLNNCSLNYKKKETQIRYTTVNIVVNLT